jgi:hypothetical protein
MPAHTAGEQCVAPVQTPETEVCFIKAVAVCGPAGLAFKAVAAGRKGEEDMIAGEDILHSFPDSLYHTSTLVPKHQRIATLEPFVHNGNIGVTDA